MECGGHFLVVPAVLLDGQKLLLLVPPSLGPSFLLFLLLGLLVSLESRGPLVPAPNLGVLRRVAVRGGGMGGFGVGGVCGGVAAHHQLLHVRNLLRHGVD